MQLKFRLFLLIFALYAGITMGQEKLSLHTRLLLEQNKSQQRSKSFTDSVNNTVSCFLVVSDEFDPSSLQPLQVTIESTFNNLLTIRTSADNIEALSHIPEVEFISVGVEVKPKLDMAVPALQADKVHAGLNLNSPYTGKDVIVGIVDIGMDFTHPTFTNSNGNLRISRSWIQTESGTGPSGFSYGKEYIGETALRQKKYSDNSESHGTHVSAIAAGSGKNSKYKGIAYDAEIVFVETGATDTEIVDAVNYIFKYAESVNKPAVVNISLGGHWGPHDGTSFSDNAFNNLVGEGKIIVGSAGNEGDANLHAQHSFISDRDTLRSIIGIDIYDNENKTGSVNVWSDPNTSIDIAFEIYDLSTRKVVESIPFGASSSYYNVNKQFTFNRQTISIIMQSYARYQYNQKPYAQIRINNPLYDRYGVALLVKGKSGQEVHMWNVGNGGGAEFSSLPGTSTTGWIAGNNSISVAEVGGTGENVISVGSYSTRIRWTDVNNQSWTISETLGDRNSFSSQGPTVDGRMKPDVSAPGSMISSAINSFDNGFFNDERFLIFRDNSNYYYGLMEGTSMAAPMMTGTVALMLQRNPELTPDDIKAALKEFSTQDAMTGNIGDNGSNTWGYGKLNTYAVVSSPAIAPAADPNNILLFYERSNNTLIIEPVSGETLDIERVEIFNLIGRKLLDYKNPTTNQISIPYASGAILIVKISANGKSVTRKICY